MKACFRRLAPFALVAQIFALVAPSADAQGFLSPSAAYVFYSPAPPDFSPHLEWRLASAFSAGLADFLFDVRVLKNLPADRLDDATKADIATISSLHYLRRLLVDVERSLVRVATEIHAEKPDQEFKATFESIVGKSAFPCTEGTCGLLELKKLVGLMIPGEAMASWAGDAEAKTVKVFLDNFPQARIYGYAGGAGDTAMNAVPSLMRRRRFDVTCAANGPCVGKGKGGVD